MMIPFPAFEVLWNLLDAKVRKVDLIKSQKPLLFELKT